MLTGDFLFRVMEIDLLLGSNSWNTCLHQTRWANRVTFTRSKSYSTRKGYPAPSEMNISQLLWVNFRLRIASRHFGFWMMRTIQEPARWWRRGEVRQLKRTVNGFALNAANRLKVNSVHAGSVASTKKKHELSTDRIARCVYLWRYFVPMLRIQDIQKVLETPAGWPKLHQGGTGIGCADQHSAILPTELKIQMHFTYYRY